MKPPKVFCFFIICKNGSCVPQKKLDQLLSMLTQAKLKLKNIFDFCSTSCIFGLYYLSNDTKIVTFRFETNGKIMDQL